MDKKGTKGGVPRPAFAKVFANIYSRAGLGGEYLDPV